MLAAVLLVAAATLAYLNYRTGLSVEPLDAVHEMAHVNRGAGAFAVLGVLLVVGLAAISASLNEGFLPSVVLACAPSYGAHRWTIGSLTEIANLYLDPASAAMRILPLVPVYATLGFLVGMGVRLGRERSERLRSGVLSE